MPLSNFVPRRFGFVYHSIAILYHQVPNPYLTIRNFCIAVLQTNQLLRRHRRTEGRDGAALTPADTTKLRSLVLGIVDDPRSVLIKLVRCPPFALDPCSGLCRAHSPMPLQGLEVHLSERSSRSPGKGLHITMELWSACPCLRAHVTKRSRSSTHQYPGRRRNRRKML